MRGKLLSPLGKVATVAFLTTLLFILSFPPHDYNVLAWIALTFYIKKFRTYSLIDTVKISTLFGVLFFSIFLSWINYYSLLVYLVATFVGAVSVVIGTLLWRSVERISPRCVKLLMGPALWVCIEWIVHQSPFNFPLSYGLTQAHFTSIIQVASITGIYGVSFLLLLCNSIVAYLIQQYYEKHEKIRGISYIELALPVVIFISLISINYTVNERQEEIENKISVAIVQGNTPDWMLKEIEKTGKYSKDNMRKFITLSKIAAKSKPNIIVWPETAVRQYVFNIPHLRDPIINIAKQANSYFIIGSPSINRKGEIYNSAHIVSPAGEILGKYDKVYLAPSENKFTKGRESPPLKTPLGKIGILICYETTLPQLARKLVYQGASILFFLINDAGFPRSAEPYLHANQSIFRAVENRIYVVRAANTGISQIIDPYGHILSKARLNETEIVTGDVLFKSGGSVYTKIGDSFALLCFVSIVTLVVGNLITNYQKKV